MIPQIYLYEEDGVDLLQDKKEKIFAGELELTLLLWQGRALVQTHHLVGDSKDRLDQAMAAATDSWMPSNDEWPPLLEWYYEPEGLWAFWQQNSGGLVSSWGRDIVSM